MMIDMTNNEARGVIKFTKPGATRATYLKRVDVCSNLPVGTNDWNRPGLSYTEAVEKMNAAKKAVGV